MANRLLESLFRFLLFLAHVVYKLGLLLERLVQLPFQLNRFQELELSKLRLSCSELSKVPRHIAISFEADDILVPQIQKLVLWSISAGIPYITLYDFEGYRIFITVVPETFIRSFKGVTELSSTGNFGLRRKTF